MTGTALYPDEVCHLMEEVFLFNEMSRLSALSLSSSRYAAYFACAISMGTFSKKNCQWYSACHTKMVVVLLTFLTAKYIVKMIIKFNQLYTKLNRRT